MTDQPDPHAPRDAFADHRDALARHAGGLGYVRDIDDRHLSIFRSMGPTLLVTFETEAEIADRPTRLPWSDALARRRRMSTLDIVAHGRTWFRSDGLTAFFDELTDEGFFDEFDKVIFAGGGMSAYGAAAYSVAAPGATVFLAQPYATLARDITPWERRFRSSWHLSFGPRYGNAARMIDAAERVYVVTDPTIPADAMHASLFQGDHVTRLPAYHAGGAIWTTLDRLGILNRLVAGAEAGNLTPTRFAELYRRRREDRVWLDAFMRKVDRMDRPWLTALMAGSLLQRRDDPAARRRLNAALANLEAAGHSAPAGLRPEPVIEARMAGE